MENENSPATRITFRNLEAWKIARQLAIGVYKLTEVPSLRRNAALADQMQRAAVSIPSNIAEGEERGSNRDALRFLFIAKGSLAELRTQLDIAHAIGKISASDLREKEALADRAGRLIGGLVRMRQAREKRESR